MSSRKAAERVPRPAPTSRRSWNSSASRAGKGRRIPALLFLEAAQELPRELGVVAVLPEGILGMGSFGRPAGAEPLIDVGAGDFRRLGLDHESEGIAECLAQNAPNEMIADHPDTGTTSRPQCLQTLARARIRSAQ